MRNLAGHPDADIIIQEELFLAGITPVLKDTFPDGEVPSRLAGVFGDWTFSRAWTYWRANAEQSPGLPLDLAVRLHTKEYPFLGPRQPVRFGDVVRVDGDCGAPHPAEYATTYDREGRWLIVDPDGTKQKDIKRFMDEFRGDLHAPGLVRYMTARFVPSLEGITHTSFVDSYHIDTMPGLKEFADTVREHQSRRVG